MATTFFKFPSRSLITAAFNGISHRSSKVTFKQKSLDYLLQNEDYKSISVQRNSTPLAFQVRQINWNTNSAINLVKNLSVSETVQALYLMRPEDFSETWKWELDSVLSSKLQQCGIQEGLYLASAFLLVTTARKPSTPSELKKSVFYQSLLERMVIWIKSASDPKHLVLLAYLAGLGKSDQKAIWRLRELYDRFRIHLGLFRSLTIDEAAIICNSWFTANIFISSRALLRILEPLLMIELNSNGPTAYALPLLKVMRRADFSTDELLNTVSVSLSSPSTLKLNLALVTHTLAILADQNFSVNDALVKNVIDIIDANKHVPIINKQVFHPTEGVREKDITRLMWCLSCLVSKETDKQQIASKMIDLVERYLNLGLFNGRDQLLLDFLLSLASWQIYPRHIIEPLITESFINKFLKEQIAERHWQLALFLWMARLEVPHLNLPWECYHTVAEHLGPVNPKNELRKRRYLSRLFETVKTQAAVEGWENVQCTYVVPHLNIAGITFDNGRYYFKSNETRTKTNK